MSEALKAAEAASQVGEVPVGAVVVVGGRIVARAHNEVETLGDASAHAELLALQRASKSLGTWRLDEASLVVTLEPCSMCIGAMVLARVKRLYFGCYDPKQGAVGSLFNLADHPELPHQVEVFPELMAEESERLLKDFFAKLRK